MEQEISLSVHDIVDSLLRTGDLDNRVFNAETMEVGSQVHRLIQSEQNADYLPEYPLETYFQDGEITLHIQGRADGLIRSNPPTIDEIKSTVEDLKKFRDQNFQWHQGQAKLYAWMYCRENRVDRVIVRLTYVKQRKESDRLIEDQPFTFQELDEFAHELIGEWLQRYRNQREYERKRDASLKALSFPFQTWRKGQRFLFERVSDIAQKGEQAYVQAPTGIGKTVCAIMPTCRAIGQGEIEKIYYLTSKNSIRMQALKTAEIMERSGGILRTIALTAKDRICLNDPRFKKRCNPDECPFAKDYYTKINSVIEEAYKQRNIFDKSDIIDLAKKHVICPFELELDMARRADLIICDYNYIFDPSVQLSDVAMGDGLPFSLLVDEAHNLPDRARSMYSSSLKVSTLAKCYSELSAKVFRKTRESLSDLLFNLSTLETEKRDSIQDSIAVLTSIPDDFLAMLKNFTTRSNEDMKKHPGEAPQILIDLRNEVKKFRLLPPGGQANYIQFLRYDGQDLTSIDILCLDASEEVKQTTDRFHSALFFSATLSPLDYFIERLGGSDTPAEDRINIPSPFDSRNRLVCIDTSIDTTYRARQKTLNPLISSIRASIEPKRGNYLIFFPSFAYMNMVEERLKDYPDWNIYTQQAKMTIEERDAFISEFHPNPERTTVGLAVLGGIFGEGIEMAPHALSGVIVVSVGFPSMDFENQKMKDYFDQKGLDGTSFAWIYPGFNRVVQAAGRIIRSESDIGIITLIDRRFARRDYGIMLKENFGDCTYVRGEDQLREKIESFWEAHRTKEGE